VVAKFAPDGTQLWSKRFGGIGGGAGRAIAIDSKGLNFYVAGEFSGTVDLGGDPLVSAGLADIFVARFASDGSHLWSKGFGGTSNDRGLGIAVHGSDLVLTGHFGATVDFGGEPLTSAGSSDILVAKLSAGDGSHRWSKRFGSPTSDGGAGVAIDADGNVLVTGVFRATVNFGGGPLEAQAGKFATFVAKFDAAGSHRWSDGFGGTTGSSEGFGITTDGDGNVLVTGSATGTVNFGGGSLDGSSQRDIFVAKFASTGSHLWSQRFGDFDAAGFGIATDAAGNVLVTGYFAGTVNFGGGPLTSAIHISGAVGTSSSDIFVVKFAPEGSHVWSKQFGNDYTDQGVGIATDAIGNVLVTGVCTGAFNFGGGTPTSSTELSLFLVKLRP